MRRAERLKETWMTLRAISAAARHDTQKTHAERWAILITKNTRLCKETGAELEEWRQRWLLVSNIKMMMMMISWTKNFNFDITHHSFAYLIQLINSETTVLSAGWLTRQWHVVCSLWEGFSRFHIKFNHWFNAVSPNTHVCENRSILCRLFAHLSTREITHVELIWGSKSSLIHGTEKA